ELIESVRSSSGYEQRFKEIEKFNSENRWKKRGISLTPIKWGIGWNGGYYNCMVSIYAKDGSVSISHGGVEMGQGIHTKVAQVCAYELAIPIETISIKPADSFTNLNAQATGGSITSELVSQACIECCKIIQKNLAPVREKMPKDYTWQQLIQKALGMGVDLAARYWIYPETKYPFEYCIYGAC
ncbi:xanthine dehydrogenase-like, partial [Brachionus plicatilis]